MPIPARCPASVNECGAINPATGWKTTTMPKWPSLSESQMKEKHHELKYGFKNLKKF